MLKKRKYKENGFSVEIVRYHSIQYSEKGKSLIIHGEVLVGEPQFVLYVSTLKEWESPRSEKLTNDKKDLVIKNICKALEFWEIKYVLE